MKKEGKQKNKKERMKKKVTNKELPEGMRKNGREVLYEIGSKSDMDKGTRESGNVLIEITSKNQI